MIFPDVTEDSPSQVAHVREPGSAGESGSVHGTVTQIGIFAEKCDGFSR
jgi:hypothetical protein